MEYSQLILLWNEVPPLLLITISIPSYVPEGGGLPQRRGDDSQVKMISWIQAVNHTLSFQLQARVSNIKFRASVSQLLIIIIIYKTQSLIIMIY